MRQVTADHRLNPYSRFAPRRTATAFHTAALYSSLAVIAAVLFGTLSVHPF